MRLKAKNGVSLDEEMFNKRDKKRIDKTKQT